MDHFSSVGFDLQGTEAFKDLVTGTVRDVPGLPIPGGGWLIRWEDPASSAVLAIALSRDSRLVCAKPALVPSSHLRLIPQGIVEDPKCPHCSLVSVDVIDEQTQICYPLFIELQDIALRRADMVFGQPTTARVAAFAESLKVWPDRTAYSTDPAQHMAPESVIPTGMFHPDPTQQREPRAEAILTGSVLKADRRVNGRSGLPFLRALVKTLCAEVDVAADLRTVPGGMLAPGNVVQGTFWLVGQMAPLPSRDDPYR